MVGLRYPSLSLAPLLPTPGKTAVERSSANNKKTEGLAVQLSRGTCQGTEKPGLDGGLVMLPGRGE